jgi:UDP-glucose 4-epimerase
MRILVTGATGYLGSKLCAVLAAGGHGVSALVRDPLSRAAKDLEVAGIRLFSGRVEEASSLAALRAEKFDAVFHLAAEIDLYASVETLTAVNVTGTRNILALAEAASAAKFIYAGSVEAMGPVPAQRAADENYPPAPVSAYGASKLEAELAVSAFTAQKPLERTIFRIGNVYGPPRKNFIYPVLAAIAKKDLLYRQLGRYSVRRASLVHIDDAVAALLLPLSRPAGGTFILTGDAQPTWGEVFDMCARLGFGLTALVAPLPGEARVGEHSLLDYILSDDGGERVHRAYSNMKLREKLGFTPAFSPEAGISDTIRYYHRTGSFPFRLSVGDLIKRALGRA